MKETQRRLTVTSYLNVISTDQLGNRVVVRGGVVTHPAPHDFLQSASDYTFQDEVNSFFSSPNIGIMVNPSKYQLNYQQISLKMLKTFLKI
jgi:hypothetical protein